MIQIILIFLKVPSYNKQKQQKIKQNVKLQDFQIKPRSEVLSRLNKYRVLKVWTILDVFQTGQPIEVFLLKLIILDFIHRSFHQLYPNPQHQLLES